MIIVILILAISVIAYILYQVLKGTEPLHKPITPEEIRKKSVIKKIVVDSSKSNYVRTPTSKHSSNIHTMRDDDFSTFQHSIHYSSQDYSSGHSHHSSNDHGGGGDFGGGGSSDSWGSSSDSSSSSDSGSSYSSND